MKELTKRVIVALFGAPILLFLSYMGGYYFLAMVIIVNIMALWEFYSIYKEKDIYPYRIPGVALSVLFLIVTFYYPQYWQNCLIIILVIFLLFHLSKQKKGLGSVNTAFTIMGFAYVTLFLWALLHLRLNLDTWLPIATQTATHAGGRFIIVMFGAIWICDTAAYSGGKLLGKHKLASTISPNKTVEGALFGLVFGIISFVGLGMLLLPGLTLWYSVVSGVIVGVFGQVGDLVESRIKRDAGVKDTSTLLPGHGGFLDRFDSIIFVSPFFLALFVYTTNV